jgi:hypothetical protein
LDIVELPYVLPLNKIDLIVLLDIYLLAYINYNMPVGKKRATLWVTPV